MGQPVSSDPLTRLSSDIESAVAAAIEVAGMEPLGLRPVEPGTGGRGYVVAFDGPAFLCLNTDLKPERSAARADELARAVLLIESAEELLDPVALRALTPAVEALAQWEEDLTMALHALSRAGEAALHLAEWREDHLRAVASLVALDDAIGRQNRARGAYAAFVGATETLVTQQESLDTAMVQALGAAESAAAAAGLADSLGGVLAGSMGLIEEGAAEMMAAHLTPLR